MKIWDLDEKTLNAYQVKEYMRKHGLDLGTNPKFRVGMVINFFTGYNNDIRARARIKGINGNELYVYSDCYWYPIKDDTGRNITIVEGA